MLLIKCPYCGERDQSEFTNGGEAHVTRPKNPEQVTDREWAEYVFIRSNPKGIYYERWVHTHGCKNISLVVLMSEYICSASSIQRFVLQNVV